MPRKGDPSTDFVTLSRGENYNAGGFEPGISTLPRTIIMDLDDRPK